MSFLNPLFLFGLAAAAIPVIIHLFTRRRPKEIPFPSLEFLSEVNQSEIRRLRIKQWLLLALRVLAIACIALAMSRPAVRGAIGARAAASTSMVVLVDRSGSMGASAADAQAGGATLSARAQRVVEDLLTTLGPEDEVLLVPYALTARPHGPRPSSDLARVRAGIQALAPLAETTDHLQALETAARALREARALNRELFWVSDFQRAGFARPGAAAPARFTAPEGPWAEARVYLIPLEPRSRANVALQDAALTPAEQDVALSVTGLALGTRPGDLAVEVRDAQADQPLGRGFLNLPERGEATTLMPLARLPEQGGYALLPDDALPLDNRRYFASGRSGTLRVLVREERGPSAARLALEAGSPASGLSVEAVDAATLPARVRDADAIVLNDLERLGAAELQAMLDFHRGGGGILVILGERADPAFWNRVLTELALGRMGAVAEAPQGAAWRLVREAAGHPVLAGFPARPGEPISSARFARVRDFTAAPGARVLAAFDRRRPGLVEAPRAFAFTAPLDPSASDFPVSGAFLPLLHQAVHVLGRGTAAASLLPGERYSAPAGTGDWVVQDAAGRTVASELVAEQGATRLVTAPLEQPGLYRVLRDGALRSTFAVNPDVRESDLAALAEPALVGGFPAGRARVVRPGSDLAARVREARFGRELWGLFIVLALLLLAAETVLARWGLPGTVPAGAPAGAASRGREPVRS